MIDYKDHKYTLHRKRHEVHYHNHKRILILAIILFSIPLFGFFSGYDRNETPEALNQGRTVIAVPAGQCPVPDQPAPVVSLDGYTLIDYKLTSGDNFAKISSRTGIDIELIKQANCGLQPRKLKAGTLVKLPITGNVVRIKIQRGDSIGSIARSFRVSIDQIKKRNRLSSTLIHPGLQLIIDLPASASGA